MTAARVGETLFLLVAREIGSPEGCHRARGVVAQSSDDSPQACLWDMRGQSVAAQSENGCTMALEMYLKRDFPCSGAPWCLIQSPVFIPPASGKAGLYPTAESGPRAASPHSLLEQCLCLVLAVVNKSAARGCKPGHQEGLSSLAPQPMDSLGCWEALSNLAPQEGCAPRNSLCCILAAALEQTPVL